MAAPANLRRLVKHVVSMPEDMELTNERLITAAGGNDAEWGRYLAGARVSAIVGSLNTALKVEGVALYNVSHKRWIRLALHEYHCQFALKRLEKADKHLQNAYHAVRTIAEDERAPEEARGNAWAWIELFGQEAEQWTLAIFKDWAGELMEALDNVSQLSLKL